MGEPGQTVNLVLLAEWVRIQQPPPLGCLTEALDVASVKSFHFAGVAQLVEHQPSKLRVAGSSLVARSYCKKANSLEEVCCQCSSGVEHFHGKEGVGGSIPPIGSRLLGNVFFDYNFISKIRY